MMCPCQTYYCYSSAMSGLYLVSRLLFIYPDLLSRSYYHPILFPGPWYNLKPIRDDTNTPRLWTLCWWVNTMIIRAIVVLILRSSDLISLTPLAKDINRYCNTYLITSQLCSGILLLVTISLHFCCNPWSLWQCLRRNVIPSAEMIPLSRRVRDRQKNKDNISSFKSHQLPTLFFDYFNPKPLCWVWPIIEKESHFHFFISVLWRDDPPGFPNLSIMVLPSLPLISCGMTESAQRRCIPCKMIVWLKLNETLEADERDKRLIL